MRNRSDHSANLAIVGVTRMFTFVFVAVLCLTTPAAIVSAAPAPVEPDNPLAMEDVGDGWYRITASVFAEGTDGAVGTLASSGYLIQPNDNLVSLPGCTESSCPWVPVGTGIDGSYGPQTTCAEADGQCWVEIVSEDTGQCTVAPVHDRGPFNIRDNWWAPQSQRKYNLPQGEPAAEFLARGGDLGFGPGISDSGYDVQHVWTYAAGIDIAGGTWKAMGLPTAAGITKVKVRMLWQVGLTHDQGCSNAPAPQPTPAPTQPPATPNSNAAVDAGALNLRSGPSYSDSVRAVMLQGARVRITGPSQNGFYPLQYGSISGWAFGEYLAIDAGTDPGSGDNPPVEPAIAIVIDGALNLRASASTNSDVLAVMPDGVTVTVTGQESNGFLPVTYGNLSGWAYALYLDTGDTPPAGDTATVIDGALNLRASASTSAAVVTVLPNGAVVTLAGESSNGFSRVSWNGLSGWAYSLYLATGDIPVGNGIFATVFDGALNLRAGAGTGFEVLTVMPDAARVEFTGASENGFSQVIYLGLTGWASDQWLLRDSTASTATVFDGALNLRADASTDAAILTVMPDGANVTLLGSTQNGFAKVRYGSTDGWAYAAYLQ